MIMSYDVYLYVYDISNGLGIYHTSVTVHGIELAYNAHGVLIHRLVSPTNYRKKNLQQYFIYNLNFPKGESHFNQPKNVEYMGQTFCSKDQLLSYVNALSSDQFQ